MHPPRVLGDFAKAVSGLGLFSYNIQRVVWQLLRMEAREYGSARIVGGFSSVGSDV